MKVSAAASAEVWMAVNAAAVAGGCAQNSIISAC